MDVSLNPVFYAQVASLAPSTVQLLPLTKKGTQKVVVGDGEGVLSCFSIKKGEPTFVFKTLPGHKITRVKLGGVPGAAKERIFFAAGVEVFGYSKKGKQFLRFDTNLTEDIQNIYISGVDLFVSGNNVYNHFEDCKDTDYYLCSDKINDVLCLPPEKTTELSPVLACQDCALRLLRGSELVYEVEVAGPPKCITLYETGQNEASETILYGTQNGRIGLVQLGPEEPVYHWDIDNDKREGGVTCLSVHDVLMDGVPDVLVGRDDGTVQLYSLDESDEPILKFSHSFPESISSVNGGYVASAEHKEIVVGTYNGQILGMTSRTSLQQTEIISSETKAKIAILRQEITQLEDKIHGARERYKENITTSGEDSISAIPKFEINDRFLLNQDEAWYTLSIETQVPLDTIILQSNVPLDIQEVDKSVAVVSYTPPDVEIGNYVLVTYRLNNATRLEVKIRTIEGQHGTIQAYVIPITEPKTCRLQKYFVKPLSLHQRVHTFDDSRPYNTLSITGNFSLGEAHAWLRFCLPDVPEHIPVDDEATLYFKGVFTGTQLECSYKQGSLAFRTDNMSTLTVLKDALSKEATEKNVAVNISFDLNQESVPHMLRLIFPLLEHQLMLAKNVQLIEALQEIKVGEADISFMPPQWRLILDNSELIQSEFKMQPCMVERIYALITDLYMDRANFKGENVKSKVPQLLETLEGCELESILAFFEAC